MAGQKISSMYVEIGADTGDLEKGLKQVEKELGKVAKEFYASAESLNKFGNTSAAAQESLKKLDAEFALGGMSQDKYREGLEAVKRGAGLVSDKSLDAAREIKKLTGDFAGGKITAEQYAASVGKVQSSLTTATKAHMSFGEAVVVANQGMQLAEQVLAKVEQAYNATVGEAMNYNRAMMDLSQNIGMSIEETSRLVQVADDFTVSQEAVTSAMQMMVKRGLAPSINGLADIADQYVKIKDPVKQAALMTELLGRNWTSLTPMLKEGGQAIRDNAAAQSDALIVTEEMAKKTRELEIAQDDFNDSILAVKLSLGNGLIPAVTTTLNNYDFFSKAISGTLTEEEKFNNAIVQATKYFGENSKAVEVSKKGFADYLVLKKQIGMTDTEKNLRAETAALYANSDGLSANSLALEGNVEDALSLSDATSKLTAEFIFQKASANMTTEAALQLGLSMGVVKQGTVDVLDSLAELRIKYDLNRDGAIDASEATKGYNNEVLLLKNNIDKLESKSITITTMFEEIIGRGSSLPPVQGPQLPGKTGASSSTVSNNTVNAPININAGNGVNINALAAAVSQRIARDLRGANNSGAGYRS